MQYKRKNIKNNHFYWQLQKIYYNAIYKLILSRQYPDNKYELILSSSLITHTDESTLWVFLKLTRDLQQKHSLLIESCFFFSWKYQTDHLLNICEACEELILAICKHLCITHNVIFTFSTRWAHAWWLCAHVTWK